MANNLTQIDDRLAKTAALLEAAVARDQARDEQLDRLTEQTTRLIRSLQEDGLYEEGGASSRSTGEGGEEEEEEETPSYFEFGLALILAVVGLFAGLAGWESTGVDFESADVSGLQATLNAEVAQFINNDQLFNRYRAYTSYIVNNELAEQLDGAIAAGVVEDPTPLIEARNQAADASGASRLFFPSRYLDRGGNYDQERDLEEAWAQTAQLLDVYPDYHFADADVERDRTRLFTLVFVGLSLSLLLLTMSEVIHPDQKIMRYGATVIGIAFFVSCIAATYTI